MPGPPGRRGSTDCAHDRPGPDLQSSRPRRALYVAMAGALANRRELEETVGRSGAVACATTRHRSPSVRGPRRAKVGPAVRSRSRLGRRRDGRPRATSSASRPHHAAARVLRRGDAARASPCACRGSLARRPAMVDVVLALGTVPAPATAYWGGASRRAVVWEPDAPRATVLAARFPAARDGRSCATSVAYASRSTRRAH